MPTVETDDNDVVDFGLFLENFERVDDDGFIFDAKELFRDVLSHARANATGDNDCNFLHNRHIIAQKEMENKS